MKVKIGNYRKDDSTTPRIERIEIHPWDTYSAYHTLSLIIYPMLLAFKNDVVEKGSVPSDFFQAVDVSDKTEEEAKAIHDKIYSEALEKWLSVLDKMIWSFGEIKDDYEGEQKFFGINFDEDITDIKDRYDIDNDGLNDYYQKVDEGLALFARHYRSLWW
jgi:hypothetical protein